MIKSPLYVARYDKWDDFGPISYHIFNTIAPHERISVFYVDDKHMEIYKFNNMNSEYYARISRTDKRGKKFSEILSAKRTAAMLNFLDEYATLMNHTPHR